MTVSLLQGATKVLKCYMTVSLLQEATKILRCYMTISLLQEATPPLGPLVTTPVSGKDVGPDQGSIV